MSTAQSIPVIVLNWNGWDDTLVCLRSIKEADANARVWLVDNGSKDDRSDEAVAVLPQTRILQWDDNYGWAGGYNRALAVAAQEKVEFAYLINNDCIVTPGFLEATLETALEYPHAAAIGSRVAYARDKNWLLFDGEYYPPGVRQTATDSSVVFAPDIHGGAMLIRLKAFLEVGVFGERFFCYGEESEWCARATAMGWSLLVSGRSLVYHLSGGSNVNANSQYYLARNKFLIFEGQTFLRRVLSIALHSYKVWRAANEARRMGNQESPLALCSAVWDGLHNRYGKRAASPPMYLVTIFCNSWPFASGTFRLWIDLIRNRIRRQYAPGPSDTE